MAKTTREVIHDLIREGAMVGRRRRVVISVEGDRRRGRMRNISKDKWRSGGELEEVRRRAEADIEELMRRGKEKEEGNWNDLGC